MGPHGRVAEALAVATLGVATWAHAAKSSDADARCGTPRLRGRPRQFCSMQTVRRQLEGLKSLPFAISFNV